MSEIRFLDGLGEIPAADWDALVPDGNPFVSHAFLSGMETKGCLREDYGWKPYHLAIFDGGRLVAAAPTYLKGNSHGEFVFDWSWASAWERAGGDYYPKLLVAAPYSPVPGPRLLVREGPGADIHRNRLTAALVDEADRLGLSSIHANFLAEADLHAFDDRWLIRADYQFHWHNRGYADFDGFLDALARKKRKNIRQERAHAAASGLTLEMRRGDTLSDAEWRQIHGLYELTFDMKGNHAALTARFFQYLGRTLGSNVQVALARDDRDIVAMALFLRSADALYGRYWGASVELSGLHFELCYYRGIDYAIREGLARFEPGAQGEHKLARGFLPTLTHSRHYIAHEGFRQAVADALVHEAAHREAYKDELMTHSPYADR
ncbi:MAG: GNAT family N-acetyltransferase [Luteibacter sp.]|uniref:GNAT family N-acetyltransferase n=1 Tax=Luteibacter sp. TaxID=1886636 RepID=UPI002808F1FB|nr:GNAT family N-acetyltransferase [Luteibacter sp.]MDQ7997950.1 GNAT family N-acetyltransferase [Luteibacter sp.]MDQ8050511.1 GNAT family N-acetyltransferase [Luteibacter sp.]